MSNLILHTVQNTILLNLLLQIYVHLLTGGAKESDMPEECLLLQEDRLGEKNASILPISKEWSSL